MFPAVQWESATAEEDKSFLDRWCEARIPAYHSEYGGLRAGTPKGDPLPFPKEKIDAAFRLVGYGTYKLETLAKVAKSSNLSPGVLRVWRTEERFLRLYRRLVWDLADSFLLEIVREQEKSDEKALAKDNTSCENLFSSFGIPCQQAILRRLCVDVLKRDTVWIPLTSNRIMAAECTLVGDPITPCPRLYLPSVCWDLTAYMLIRMLPEPKPKNPAASFICWEMDRVLENRLLHELLARCKQSLIAGDETKALAILELLEQQTRSDFTIPGVWPLKSHKGMRSRK